LETGKWTDIADSYFGAPQAVENACVLGPQKRPPNPSRFRLEKVNEVTWKLTNGELTNVPAAHGYWSGYRVTKALGWVIDIGLEKPAWLARVKDECAGPMPLKLAKAAVLAMVKGAPGDYQVRHSIAHLNGLAARCVDNGRPDASQPSPVRSAEPFHVSYGTHRCNDNEALISTVPEAA